MAPIGDDSADDRHGFYPPLPPAPVVYGRDESAPGRFFFFFFIYVACVYMYIYCVQFGLRPTAAEGKRRQEEIELEEGT